MTNEIRRMRIEAGPLTYWTLVDEAFQRVPVADAFLLHLRLGGGRAENTTRSYAADLAAFYLWKGDRTFLTAARELDLLVGHLRLTPVVVGGVSRPRSARSITRLLAAVRGMYRHGVGVGSIPAEALTALYDIVDDRRVHPDRVREDGTQPDPVRVRHKVRVDTQGVPDAVSPEVFGVLLENTSSARDRYLMALMRLAGLRIGAALGLRRSDQHFVDEARPGKCSIKGAHLHVTARMNRNRAAIKGRAYAVPVSNDLLQFYEDYLVEREGAIGAGGSDYVLVNLHGEGAGSPMSYSNAWRRVRGAAERAGMGGSIHPHMFRHGFGTDLGEAGVPIQYIQELLGHRSLSSTSIYVHPSMESLRKAVRMTEGRPSSAGPGDAK